MNTFRTLLAAAISVSFLAFVPAVVNAASPTVGVAPDALSAVVGKTCRGYYKQSEGGTGSLQRTESAFKTGVVARDGSFVLTAAFAKSGASDGWATTSGNAYLVQGTMQFKLQPDGALVFANVAAFSSYRLTPVPGSAPGTDFTVIYSHGAGTAVGKAVCR